MWIMGWIRGGRSASLGPFGGSHVAGSIRLVRRLLVLTIKSQTADRLPIQFRVSELRVNRTNVKQ
jgi:hypothetical protein